MRLRWARPTAVAAALISLIPLASAIIYTPSLADYNLNTNQQATKVTDYSTTKLSSYTPSPDNWRKLPVYTLLLDKFADGDPSTNDYFKTVFEWDWRETQLRYGGDLAGLVSHLDYIQGMGVGLIFIAGTPFLNMPWQADSERSSPACPSAPRFSARNQAYMMRLNRLLAYRLLPAGPTLGNAGGLAKYGRRSTQTRDVHHDGFHRWYHGGLYRMGSVSRIFSVLTSSPRRTLFVTSLTPSQGTQTPRRRSPSTNTKRNGRSQIMLHGASIRIQTSP